MKPHFTYAEFMDLLKSSSENDLLIKNQLSSYDGNDIRLLGAKSFLEKEDDIHKLKAFLEFNPTNHHKKNKQNTVHRKIYYKIAAGVLLALILSFGGIYFFKPKNYYQLYSVKDSGLNVFMGESASNIDDLMTEYKNENFEKAKSMSLKLISQNPTNDTLHYYLGVINCELKLPNEAIQEFNLVSKQATILYERAFYSKTLCLMAVDKEKAKNNLLEITKNSNNTYYKQALIVLEKEY